MRNLRVYIFSLAVLTFSLILISPLAKADVENCVASKNPQEVALKKANLIKGLQIHGLKVETKKKILADAADEMSCELDRIPESANDDTRWAIVEAQNLLASVKDCNSHMAEFSGSMGASDSARDVSGINEAMNLMALACH